MIYDNENTEQRKMKIFGIKADQSNQQVLYTFKEDVRKHGVGMCWIIAGTTHSSYANL